jgi:nucleotide-binding universal stress UspA family protein
MIDTSRQRVGKRASIVSRPEAVARGPLTPIVQINATDGSLLWRRSAVFKHILIAIDGSELAHKAVTQGLELASRLQARVLVVMVTEPWTMIGGPLPTPSVIAAYEKDSAQNAQRITSQVIELAKKNNVACSPLHIADRHPAEGILEAAANNACDLIVMASHGRGGVGRFLLGSITMDVVVRSPVPVLVCR